MEYETLELRVHPPNVSSIGRAPLHHLQQPWPSSWLQTRKPSTQRIPSRPHTGPLSRLEPQQVEIDNDTYADRTLITLDSANRPGTLVEVVQLLTELGLNVIKARISSDGGWFVDEVRGRCGHIRECQAWSAHAWGVGDDHTMANPTCYCRTRQQHERLRVPAPPRHVPCWESVG